MRRKLPIFEVLGVDTLDDIDTIRRAWRNKVKTLHPDVAQDRDAAGDLLAQINEAFDALQGHKPFVDRRKSDRRQSPRRGGQWSKTKRLAFLARHTARLRVEERRRKAKLAAARSDAQDKRLRALNNALRRKAEERREKAAAAIQRRAGSGKPERASQTPTSRPKTSHRKDGIRTAGIKLAKAAREAAKAPHSISTQRALLEALTGYSEAQRIIGIGSDP